MRSWIRECVLYDEPDAALSPSASSPRIEGPGRAAWRRLVANRLALIGLLGCVVVVGGALFAPFLTVHDPTVLDLRAIRQPPGPGHLLGTDNVGIDVWSSLLFGARTSLLVGFAAVAISLVVGTALGAIAGFYGGLVDEIIGRTIDTFQSLPAFLMAVVFVSIAGPGLETLVLVIALAGWPRVARLVRGQVFSIREANFVLAAKLTGVGDFAVIVRHIIPNVVGPLSVAATFGVANAILVEAGLSFLGLGIRPPTPSWGASVSLARNSDVLLNLPWIWLPPAIAISIVVISVNFVGDGLREALDPKAGRYD